MKADIVIPAFNSKETLVKCIAACLKQQDSRRIIVVDDGSTDGTDKEIKQFPVEYIYTKNSGPGCARNTGWKISSADIICFTDSDCVPEEGWTRKLTGNYTSDDIAGVGGSYDIVNKNNLLADCIHQEIIYRHSKIPKDVNYLGSFNVSYRKMVLEELGGFDESFKRASGEDNDLAYRIKNKGYRLIFDKDIKVAHHYPESLKKYLKQQFWHGFWRVKLYKKHPDMKQGDHYAGMLDFIQPPLAVLTLFLLPFIPIDIIKVIVIYLFFISLLLQLPTAFVVIKTTRRIKYIYLAFITLLRGYARGLGLLIGIIKFIFLERD